MKHNLPSIIFAVVGLVFLVPVILDMSNGARLSFSPAVAAALSFFLAAMVAYFVRRPPGGRRS